LAVRGGAAEVPVAGETAGHGWDGGGGEDVVVVVVVVVVRAGANFLGWWWFPAGNLSEGPNRQGMVGWSELGALFEPHLLMPGFEWTLCLHGKSGRLVPRTWTLSQGSVLFCLPSVQPARGRGSAYILLPKPPSLHASATREPRPGMCRGNATSLWRATPCGRQGLRRVRRDVREGPIHPSLGPKGLLLGGCHDSCSATQAANAPVPCGGPVRGCRDCSWRRTGDIARPGIEGPGLIMVPRANLGS
jgi:hypothetical protein